jgi:hypothetical protein
MSLLDSLELYIKKEGIDYKRGIDGERGKQINKKDLETIRNSIQTFLSNSKRISELCQKIKFKKPSEEKLVLDCMGCTATCHFCSALLGQRGHDKNDDKTKIHHSCHQPCGVAYGLCNVNTNELSPNDYDYDYDDKWSVNCDLCSGDMVKWSIVSTDAKHCDWQYQTHHNQKFNELMSWFFVKLNNDIA